MTSHIRIVTLAPPCDPLFSQFYRDSQFAPDRVVVFGFGAICLGRPEAI